DFASGLFETLCPDESCPDGPLTLPTQPWTRAAPSTPARPTTFAAADLPVVDMAFVTPGSTRLSRFNPFEAAGFTSCCGPRPCLPPIGGSLHPAWHPESLPTAGVALPGAPLASPDGT